MENRFGLISMGEERDIVLHAEVSPERWRFFERVDMQRRSNSAENPLSGESSSQCTRKNKESETTTVPLHYRPMQLS